MNSNTYSMVTRTTRQDCARLILANGFLEKFVSSTEVQVGIVVGARIYPVSKKQMQKTAEHALIRRPIGARESS